MKRKRWSILLTILSLLFMTTFVHASDSHTYDTLELNGTSPWDKEMKRNLNDASVQASVFQSGEESINAPAHTELKDAGNSVRSSQPAGTSAPTRHDKSNLLLANALVSVTSVSLNKSNLTLAPNQFEVLVASIKPALASNKSVTWKSSNPLVASVDTQGKVTAKKEGTAEITVKTTDGAKTAVVQVVVSDPANHLTSLQLFSAYNASVAYVECYDFNNQLMFTGSGFMVKANGTFVTNYHVIYDEEIPLKYVNIKFGDGTEYTNVTRVLDYDKKNDIAVLRIPNVTNRPFIPVGNSNLLVTGQEVVAIGSPLGYENTISEGIVSLKSRVVDGVDYIQISLPIDHGSSGGVLLNRSGEAIGITSAGEDESIADLNFAIPINKYKNLALDRETTIRVLNLPNVQDDLLIGEEEMIEQETNDYFDENHPLTYETTYVEGSLEDSYDSDYYVLKLNQSVSVTMYGYMHDTSSDSFFTSSMGMEIYDSYGELVATSQSFVYPDQLTLQNMEYELGPGIYYIVISPKFNYFYFDQEICPYSLEIYFY